MTRSGFIWKDVQRHTQAPGLQTKHYTMSNETVQQHKTANNNLMYFVRNSVNKRLMATTGIHNIGQRVIIFVSPAEEITIVQAAGFMSDPCYTVYIVSCI